MEKGDGGKEKVAFVRGKSLYKRIAFLELNVTSLKSELLEVKGSHFEEGEIQPR